MSKFQLVMLLLFVALLGQETECLPHAVPQLGYEEDNRVRRQGGYNEGELRISKGTPNRGYLEYCLNNQFGIVCGDSFDDKDAQVACRQLGHAGAESATGQGIFEWHSDNDLMYLSNIACNGSEDSFSECPVPGGPESGTVWRGKVYCSWRSAGFISGYDYNVAVINCTTGVMVTTVSPTIATGTKVEQIETQTLNFIMANTTLNAIRTAEPLEAIANLSSLMASLPSTVTVHLFGASVSRADYRANSNPIQLLEKIFEFVSFLFESVEVSEESRAVVGSSLLSILDNLALKVLPQTSNFSTPNVVVQTQLLRTDTNYYTTAITSDSFDRPQESTIQLPAELLQLADGLSGDKDGIVRVVSFLYYNVERIFPSGKPGDNGSSLASGIVSAGLQCGNTLCPTTSDINLTETVTVTIEHSDKVKERLIQDSNLFTECVFWKFLGDGGCVFPSNLEDTIKSHFSTRESFREYIESALLRYNEDLRILADQGMWPNFPDTFATIMKFKFPGEDEDPMEGQPLYKKHTGNNSVVAGRIRHVSKYFFASVM